jgi:signal transduction histidine kinase/ActR/RegA family two-component response regulator
MSDSGRIPLSPLYRVDSTSIPAHAHDPGELSASSPGDLRQQKVRAAQTRLLYENANTGVVLTVVVAALAAYAQWDVVSPARVGLWLAYMIAVSIARFALAQSYWRVTPADMVSSRWNAAFVAGAAFAGTGWGVGGVMLNPQSAPMNEALVLLVIGGVMLGSASFLAARPEAFLAFLLPVGLLASLAVARVRDEQHLIMGSLGILFTLAIIITTWRFHRAIEASFRLQFANEALIARLEKAKDATEALNRELEQRVRERTAQLEEADHRKDEFLATLAHELRNPLAPIRFALETLKGQATAVTATRAREVIERQVRQLVRLVDDLLDVSRITANKIQLRIEPLDLARLMRTAVESISPLADAAGHDLNVQLPARPISIDGDGARLVQVFSNVLNNAVKFTPRQGHIWFTADEQADVVIVRIRDSGVGISEDVLPKVFEMFHQAEPVLERSIGGLGIGLTLARRLVEMHQGEISIRSAGVGQGTEVEIRLPLSRATTARVVEAERRPGAAKRQLRVLIVEDNVDAAEMLDLTVTHRGHSTRVVHDGASAIDAAADFVPDVVFLDIGLPVMNGYAVARAMRALPHLSHVHICALTGWGQEEDRREARDAGCDSHFTKPLSPAALDELLVTIAERDPNMSHADSTPRTRHSDSGGGF